MFKRYLMLLFALLLLTGCGRFRAMGPQPTVTPTFEPVPTFTPTPMENTGAGTDDAPATAAPPTAVPPTAVPDESRAPADNAGETDNAGSGEAIVLDALVPTPTPGDEDAAMATADDGSDPAPTGPQLRVTAPLINVRQGPSTVYPIVGAATTGDTFAVTGRNEAGDWWQACCFDEQPGWLYGPLVEVTSADAVALATDIPPAPTPTPAPVAAEPVAPQEEAAPPAEAEAEAPPPADPPADINADTAGRFDPNAQYHIVGYRVIGYGENNGGIFNNGGQHLIFINVIDANGNGVDGAVVKNALADNVNIVTGAKGPGRAEFEMFWDPYKLYVASDSSGPVTSQITNQMNTAHPHIPDIVGRLGPPEEEYAICPTIDDRCEPPFFHAHWSYEVTFQKVN